jgi:ATP-dependent Clp protease ATP-binding subunit ClpB
MEIDSMPAELDDVTRRIMKLESKDELSRKNRWKFQVKTQSLIAELADLKKQENKIRDVGENEKKELGHVKYLKQLDNYKLQLQNAYNNSDYSKQPNFNTQRSWTGKNYCWLSDYANTN